MMLGLLPSCAGEDLVRKARGEQQRRLERSCGGADALGVDVYMPRASWMQLLQSGITWPVAARGLPSTAPAGPGTRAVVKEVGRGALLGLEGLALGVGNHYLLRVPGYAWGSSFEWGCLYYPAAVAGCVFGVAGAGLLAASRTREALALRTAISAATLANGITSFTLAPVAGGVVGALLYGAAWLTGLYASPAFADASPDFAFSEFTDTASAVAAATQILVMVGVGTAVGTSVYHELAPLQVPAAANAV